MANWRTLKQVFVAGVLCTIAVGCSSSDEEFSYICPRAAVVSDAVAMTQFKPGAGKDPVDVEFIAEVSDLQSGCQFKQISDEKFDLLVAVAPVVTITRGAADENRRAQFSYFVSLVGPDQSILSKQQFDIGVNFIGNQRRVVTRVDDPPVTIDIPSIRPAEVTDYEILIGLQLSAEQLEFNRRRKQARP